MNRRVALIWKWSAWSAFAAAATTGLAMWISRTDTKPVDPGTRDVAGLTDELARTLPKDVPSLHFTDVAARLSLPSQFRGPRTHQLPEDMGGGVAVADFDGDGKPDVLIVGCGTLPDGGPSYLYRNDTPSPGAPLVLTDVTKDSGLPGPLPGMGAAVADVDGDGRLDVLLTYFGGVRLLHNEGGMRFRDVTAQSGLAVADRWCSGAVFGDIDGDGDLDLYVCRYVDYKKVEGRPDLAMWGIKVPYTLNPSSFRPLPNLFFKNRGDGTFTSRAERTATSRSPIRDATSARSDATLPTESTGEGGSDLAKEFGIDDPTGRSMTAVLEDFDLDGIPDLYVANDVSDSVMYHGVVGADGVRRYVEVGAQSDTADYRGAMGLAVADADGDGDDDIFVTHWIAQENAYFRNFAVDARTGGRRMIFTDDADRVGLGAPGLDFVKWATDFVDFDLDGRFDLFVANGSTIENQSDRSLLDVERPQVFWNGGVRVAPASRTRPTDTDGAPAPENRGANGGPASKAACGFFETGSIWGDAWSTPRGLRGGAAADLDGDGDADLVLGALEGPPAVFICDGPPLHRPLAVELRAAAPNTFGIGARVTVACDGRTQSREMRSSPGYVSAGPPVLLFGLGDATGAATVRVRWPDGKTTETTVPAADRHVVVRKP